MPVTTYCWIHHVDEPLPPGGAFRVCLECGHVYAAAQDLVDEHNAVIATLGLHNQVIATLGLDDVFVLTVDTVDDISCCPLCVHDF